MTNEHVNEWIGLPVEAYDDDRSERPITQDDVKRCCFRIESSMYRLESNFAKFLANPAVAETEFLLTGTGLERNKGLAQLLVNAQPILRNLKGLFLSEIIQEELDTSSICQSDLSPLFTAYPNLEHFAVRGMSDLILGDRIRLPKLRSIAVQGTAMPFFVYQQITRGSFPVLESLEMWVGGDIEPRNLEELLSGKLFPSLRHLGLCNSEIQDDIAKAVARSQLLSRLRTLNLSMGTLSDRGGNALLASPAALALEHVDLHHHFLSRELMEEMSLAFRSVDLSQAQGERDKFARYVAVGE